MTEPCDDAQKHGNLLELESTTQLSPTISLLLRETSASAHKDDIAHESAHKTLLVERAACAAVLVPDDDGVPNSVKFFM